MMYNDDAMRKRIPTLLRLLLYAAVVIIWSEGLGESIAAFIIHMLGTYLSDVEIVSSFMLSLAVTGAKMFVTLLLMHKCVFFSAAKKEDTVIPLLACMMTMHAVPTLTYTFIINVLDYSTYSTLRKAAAGLEPFLQLLLYIGLSVLPWLLIFKCWNDARLQGTRVKVAKVCLQVGLVSIATGVVVNFGTSLWYIPYASLLVSLCEGAASLLALWLGVYRPSIDTALSSAKQESSAVFVSDSAASDEKESSAVFVGDDVPAVPTKIEKQKYIGMREEEPRRRGLFNRYDFSNDEDRVIAQSSREAIKVMEHHELDMEHEWQCDDDKKEHDK